MLPDTVLRVTPALIVPVWLTLRILVVKLWNVTEELVVTFCPILMFPPDIVTPVLPVNAALARLFEKYLFVSPSDKLLVVWF